MSLRPFFVCAGMADLLAVLFVSLIKLYLMEIYYMAIPNSDLNLLVSEAEKKQGKLIDLPRTFRSPEDVKLFYDKHGYVTLKAYIPSEYLDDVVRDLGAIFEPYSSESENPIDSGIIELDKNNQKRLYELHNAANKSTAFKFLSRFLSDVVRNISGITSPTLEIASQHSQR